MPDEKTIKVRLSSKNEGGYNTIKGRLFKEAIEVDVTAAELLILRGEAPHIIIEEIAAAPAEDLTAKELIEKIKTMTVVSEIAALFKDETRVTVKDTLKARIKELKDAK